ncbi:hypothetical protein FB451DRAFT_1230853 [Mycena latifolia]|nr:hypothetical protein FB451DRAFT_1230853 [Mycena latifolia]
MFSKLFTFGLCALSLAAATQKVVVSCSVEHLGATMLGYAARPDMEAGVYHIVNLATSGVLKASGKSVILWKADGPLGAQHEWFVEPLDSNRYHIRSILNGAAIGYDLSKPKAPLGLSGDKPGFAGEFIIDDSNGANSVIIMAPDEAYGEDRVWTAGDTNTNFAHVTLRDADDSGAQRWTFERLG